MGKLLKLIKNEDGANAIEYALVATLIAVAAIAAMSSLGSKLNVSYNNIAGSLK